MLDINIGDLVIKKATKANFLYKNAYDIYYCTGLYTFTCVLSWTEDSRHNLGQSKILYNVSSNKSNKLAFITDKNWEITVIRKKKV